MIYTSQVEKHRFIVVEIRKLIMNGEVVSGVRGSGTDSV